MSAVTVLYRPLFGLGVWYHSDKDQYRDYECVNSLTKAKCGTSLIKVSILLSECSTCLIKVNIVTRNLVKSKMPIPRL